MRQRRRGDPAAAPLKPGPKPQAQPEGSELAALRREVMALRVETVMLRRRLEEAQAQRAGPDRAQAQRAARENDRLRDALAKAEAKLAADPGEVAKLERQLKAARTRIQTLTVERQMGWDAARANPASISKRGRRKILAALHPDGSPTQRQKTEAFQLFSTLKVHETDES
jgi:hypothetical protein